MFKICENCGANLDPCEKCECKKGDANMPKGRWAAYNQVLGGERKYIAGRIIDTNQVQHAGNMEYYGSYTTDKDAVLELCEKLERGEICNHCQSPRLQSSGSCMVCIDCGETTGCS